MYLTKSELTKQILDTESIVIRPLLEKDQIGNISVDLRLGTDFLLTFQGRSSTIDVSVDGAGEPTASYFQETRRLVGSSFLFHPLQTVLCSTLEYIKLPTDIYMELSMRSSYSRLGLSISTIFQPGYCGCASMELTNVNNTPVRISVGSRIAQARFIRIDENLDYFSASRKYICQVRPEVSLANKDSDSLKLKKMHGNTGSLF